MAILYNDKKVGVATLLASVIVFHLVFLSPLVLSCPNGSCYSESEHPVEESPAVGVGSLAPSVDGSPDDGVSLPPVTPLPVEQPPPAPTVDTEDGAGSPVEGALSPPPLPFGKPFGAAAQQGAFGLGNGQQKPFGGAYQQQQPGAGASGFGQQPLDDNQLPFGGAVRIGTGSWLQLGLVVVLFLCASSFHF